MNILDLIDEAKKEAFQQAMEANIIFVNDKLAKTDQFAFVFGKGFSQSVTLFPPMIMGLKAVLTNELSDKYAFAITHVNMPKQKAISEWQWEVHQNAKAHGWWDEPRTPGELLMLITTEVSEVFEELRNGHEITDTYYKDGKMEGAPSELADIVIRVMDLCQFYGIDLEAAIAEKHKYNLTRPYKHGGKKL